MTETQPVLDPHERIFTLSDISRLVKRQKKRLMKAMWMGVVCSSLFTLIRSPKYQIEATFKEGVEKGESFSVKDFLGGVAAQQPQAISLMKSYQVLRPLTEKLGLQAAVPSSQWVFTKVWRRIKENLTAELQKPLKDPDVFVFQDVLYEGEEPLNLSFRFKDPQHFSVSFAGGLNAEGKIGSEVVLPQAKFTIAKAPKSLRVGSSYPLRIAPWILVAKNLRDQLQIVNQKSNKSIYDLQIFQRDRFLGARILNGLMDEYQNYLKKDHDELASEQLSYLEDRQEQLYTKMQGMLKEHVDYLKDTLAEDGFIGVEQEKESFLIPLQKMLTAVLAIDTNLSRLEEMDAESLSLILGDGEVSSNLRESIQQMYKLKQQRDLLEISLNEHQARLSGEFPIQTRSGELKDLRERRTEIQNLIESIDQGEEVPLSSFGFNQALSVWAERISDSQASREREDLAEYLENYSRLLSIREKMLQQRFFYETEVPSELEGIDLETAQTLFLEYNSKLDQAEGASRTLAQLKEQIHSNDFEIGSLAAVLQDPLSLELLQKTNLISMQLKDERYHSGKEGDRWRADLELDRKILSDHIGQLWKIEELKANLIREKIVGLQQATLEGINRKLSILQEYVDELLGKSRDVLLRERELIESRIDQLRQKAVGLPDKWRREKWLELKSKLSEKLIEALTEVVETKTISHHLHHVESKPLDFAVVPLLPLQPHLVMVTVLGGFLFSFITFAITLVLSILRGFPVSAEKLKVLGWFYLGPITPFCDGPSVEALKGPDLELLRKMALFVEKSPQGRVVGLIGGKGPDYSYAFAENLARISHKSIILRCDFGAKFQEKDLPGLLQIWKGEIGELPIRKGKLYDVITSGGFSPFGAEVIQSPAFKQLIDLLKKNYDSVFLLIRTPLESSESKSVLRLCDRAIVTVAEEQTEILTPFADWAYHEGNSRLTFITIDS